MATSNGRRKTAPRRMKTMTVQKPDTGPVILTPEEITNLRNRFETWQAQRAAKRFHSILEQMAQESYAAYARELAMKHLLPDDFTVNYDTGIVSPVKEAD